MSYDTKSVEELELLAADLREKIRLNHKQLQDVERWIELRRQENEAEVPAGAETSERPF